MDTQLVKVLTDTWLKISDALTKQDTKAEGPVNPLLQNNVTTN